MKKILSAIISICIIALFMLFAIGSSSSDDIKDQGTDEAKKAESSTSLGDYEVEILSSRLAKDHEEKDVIIIKYKFTNVNDDTASSFDFSVDDNAYQDGIGLNRAYFLDDSANYNSDDGHREIKKGASIELEVAYELNDLTTDVVVEVKELISLNEDVITKTFKIA